MKKYILALLFCSVTSHAAPSESTISFCKDLGVLAKSTISSKQKGEDKYVIQAKFAKLLLNSSEIPDIQKQLALFTFDKSWESGFTPIVAENIFTKACIDGVTKNGTIVYE